MTPREFTLLRHGLQKRLMREHNDRAWVTWHIAALSRAKRLPRLERLQAKQTKQKRPPQTWQEQYALMEAWAAGRNKAQAIRKQINGR